MGAFERLIGQELSEAQSSSGLGVLRAISSGGNLQLLRGDQLWLIPIKLLRTCPESRKRDNEDLLLPCWPSSQR